MRVSSIGQVNTDRDGEGFSIAAQRDAYYRKAQALGADVIAGSVDAGESARKADRPELSVVMLRQNGLAKKARRQVIELEKDGGRCSRPTWRER